MTRLPSILLQFMLFSVVHVACAAAAASGPVMEGVGWEEGAAVHADGALEPGEEGRLAVTLRNAGPSALDDATLQVRGASPAGVEVVVATARWPRLEPGQRAASRDVTLRLAAGLPCDQPVALDVVVSATGHADRASMLAFRLGSVRPALVGPREPVRAGTHAHASADWNGTEWGLAHASVEGITPAINVHRLDAAGRRVARVQLAAAGNSCSSPALAWGGDRWAVAWLSWHLGASGEATSDVWLAILGSDLGLIDQRLLWSVSGGLGAQAPSVAWDGTTFDVVFRGDRPGEEDASSRQLTLQRVLPTGAPDGPPVVVESPIVVGSTGTARAVQHLAWTGSELAVLVYRQSPGSACLVRFDRDGTPCGLGTILDGVSWQPALAWTGRGFGVAMPGGTGPALAGLRTDGTLEWGPRDVEVTSQWGEPAALQDLALGWDGAGFVLAASKEIPRLYCWVRGSWLDEHGIKRRPSADLTPSADPDDFFTLDGRLGVDPATGIALVPLIRFADADAGVSPSGDVEVQRMRGSSECPTIALPREVSAPASRSPVTATRRAFDLPFAHWEVYLEFEDVGAEADSYDVTELGRAADGSMRPQRALCHRRVGRDPIWPTGPGRLEMSVDVADEGTPTISVDYYIVTASNVAGEGPPGDGTLGPRSWTTGCSSEP